MYRVEVTRAILSQKEQQQFVKEARRAGFQVQDDGWYLTIANLTARQAAALRDGLLQQNIHSSIGISS